jgi:pimeloyl-ACP methyl ester carboxylesterase
MYSKKEDGSQFMVIDGQEVHYQVHGTGRPVLLLHGICDSLHTWRFWKDEFVNNGFQFITMDLPGYGLTGKWNKEYSTENYLELINKFTKNLKINKFSIVGNSLGGFMAWNYSIKHPTKVESLVLISPAAYPLDPPFVVHFGQDKFTRWLARTFSSKFIYDKISETVFYDEDKLLDYDKDRFYHLSLIPGNTEAYMDTFHEILKLSKTEPKLERLKTRTLLLWGKYDQWIPHKQSELWKRDVAGLKFISYDKVGHVAQLEIPKRSVSDAIHFLKNQ